MAQVRSLAVEAYRHTRGGLIAADARSLNEARRRCCCRCQNQQRADQPRRYPSTGPKHIRESSFHEIETAHDQPLPFPVADAVAATVRAVSVGANAVVLVDTSLVVSGMTACTGGCVSRRRIVDGLRIGLVTYTAVEIAAMVEWFITESGMTNVSRLPRGRTMALHAVNGRIEVSGILAGRDGAVVTGRARAKNLIVIHSRYGRPHRRRMAVFTDVGSQYVQWPLARGVTAVMT